MQCTLLYSLKTCKSLKTNEIVDLGVLACDFLKQMEKSGFNFLENECNKGELAAFVSFAIAFPSRFLALVDTYNVLKYNLKLQFSLKIFNFK